MSAGLIATTPVSNSFWHFLKILLHFFPTKVVRLYRARRFVLKISLKRLEEFPDQIANRIGC